MSAFNRAINRLPFAPIVALMFGLVALILILATPQWLFEQAVTASGLPAALPAASPPLGEKARFLAAIMAFIAVTGLGWLAARAALPFLDRPLPAVPGLGKALARNGNASAAETYVTRSRPPIFAGDDLGAPLMSEEAMTIAQDELVLETPMAAESAPADLPAPSIAAEADESPADAVADAAPEADEVADAPTPARAEWPVVSPREAVEPLLSEAEAAPAAAPHAQAAAPAADAGVHPSLSEMVDRLESALAERARRGVPANVPPEGGASTLRRLFAGAGTRA